MTAQPGATRRPLQNRVTPFGEIIRTPERGAWMGNRGGCLHDEAKTLGKRRWASRRWICCVLEFKRWHREVMTPRRYTELFFLDEATALAAGHRPCAECRRLDFRRFVEAWRAAHGLDAGPRADDMDRTLQRDRVTRGRAKVTYWDDLASVPDGAMVARAEADASAWLMWRGALHLWSPAGYTRREPVQPNETVRVLTPRSAVIVIGAGYPVAVHATAC